MEGKPPFLLFLSFLAYFPLLGRTGVDSSTRLAGDLVCLRGGQSTEGDAAARIAAVLGRRSALLGSVSVSGLPGASNAGDSESIGAPLSSAMRCVESKTANRMRSGAGDAEGVQVGAPCENNAAQISMVGRVRERAVVGAGKQGTRSLEQHIEDLLGDSQQDERAEQLANARKALADFDCIRPSLADWPGLANIEHGSRDLGLSQGTQVHAVSGQVDHGSQANRHGDDADEEEDSLQLPKNTPHVLETAKVRQENSILQRYEALQEGKVDEMEFYRARKADFDQRLSARPIHNDLLGCSERVSWDAKNALRWEREEECRPDSSYVVRDLQGRRVTPSGKLLGGEEESASNSPPAHRGPGKFINVPRWARARDNLPSIHFSGGASGGRGVRQESAGGRLLKAGPGGKEDAAMVGGGDHVRGESCWVDTPWARARAARQARRRAGASNGVSGGERSDGKPVSGRRESAAVRKHKVRMAMMHLKSASSAQRFPFLTKKNFKRAHRARQK